MEMDMLPPVVDSTCCRVCLQKSGTVPLSEGTAEMFQYCTMLKVTKEEDEKRMPRKLCIDCATNLRVAYDFRFQAVYSDKYYRATFLKHRQGREDDSNKELPFITDIDEKSKTETTITTIEQLVEGEEVIEEFVVVQHTNDNGIISEEEDGKIELSIEEVEEDEELHVTTDFITQEDNNDDTISDHFSDYFTTAENGTMEQVNHVTTIEVESLQQNDYHHVPTKKNNISPSKSNDDAASKDKYECNICGAVCAQMYSLKQHYMIHCGERPFICEFCDKAFTRPGVLRNHRHKHTGNLPYQCTQCAVSFASRMWLDRHKSREHSIEVDSMNRREYKCNKCANVYNSKYTLNAHIRLQHPPERIKMQLAKHAMMAVENDETVIDETVLEPKLKPIMYQESLYSMGEFLCSMCPASFSRKYKLIEHFQTHTESGDADISAILTDDNNTTKTPNSDIVKERKCKNIPEQRYTCDCGKTFARKPTMLLHKQFHCTPGPYQCVCCDELHDSICALKEHLIVVHEEDVAAAAAEQIQNALKCLICGIAFSTFTAYISHLDVHDVAKLFECEHCNLKFTKKFKFLYHLKTHIQNCKPHTINRK